MNQRNKLKAILKEIDRLRAFEKFVIEFYNDFDNPHDLQKQLGFLIDIRKTQKAATAHFAPTSHKPKTKKGR